MTETKKQCPLSVAKAVARMQEQHPVGRWTASHQAVLIRYMALDVLSEAQALVKKDPTLDLAKEFSARFNIVLGTVAWIVEASNCGKQLVALGVIETVETQYE